MVTIANPLAKRRRREETRQRLLEAALGVFARNGYERATVDEIVRAAGFSKGAFYVHFESKDDLFWGILQERIARQQAAFRQALDPARPVGENLARILTNVFALSRNDPLWTAMFMEFVAHGARNEKVRDELSQMYTNWRNFAVETLRAGRELGLIREDIDVDFAATTIIALIEGMMMQSRFGGDSAQLDAAIEPLSQLLGNWLAA